jgi:hypothetical protein
MEACRGLTVPSITSAMRYPFRSVKPDQSIDDEDSAVRPNGAPANNITVLNWQTDR